MKPIILSCFLFLATAVPACAADNSLTPLVGNWKGSYVCPQGHTGLTLTIDRQSGPKFSGTFHFYPLPDNILVPDGCFTISGHFVSGRKVVIAGAAWIKRPEGYVTVDLDGKIGASGAGLSGIVRMPPQYVNLCTTFELTKESDKPIVAPSCRQDSASR
jgi:hypothetical protein